ncbi:MAG: rhomboid family intramembrane serine protease [Gemmatimonadetes bacterium]|nr:rhomboid family intramembrane serine protease [Gemmatimonadota bacterium]
MTPVVGQLLLLNVLGLLFAGPGTPLFREFQLVPALMLQKPWTLITYQFLHGGMGHLFFNMIGLFFLGPRLEVRLGSRHFLGMYLVSGLVGALVHIIYTVVTAAAGGLFVPMVGASGAVYGVFLAYAKFWPKDKILLWFVIPVEIRVFVIGLTALSLWFSITGGQANVAHFAHLGGFLGGWLYLRGREWRSPANQFKKKAESPGIRMRERDLTEHWSSIDPDTLHPVNREEYDRISDKIRSLGWGALSDRERTFVQRFGGGFG